MFSLVWVALVGSSFSDTLSNFCVLHGCMKQTSWENTLVNDTGLALVLVELKVCNL